MKDIDEEIITVLLRCISRLAVELDGNNKPSKRCPIYHSLGNVIDSIDNALVVLAETECAKGFDFCYVKVSRTDIEELLENITIDIRAVIRFIIVSSFKENRDFINLLWTAVEGIERAKLAKECLDHMDKEQEDIANTIQSLKDNDHTIN